MQRQRQPRRLGARVRERTEAEPDRPRGAVRRHPGHRSELGSSATTASSSARKASRTTGAWSYCSDGRVTSVDARSRARASARETIARDCTAPGARGLQSSVRARKSDDRRRAPVGCVATVTAAPRPCDARPRYCCRRCAACWARSRSSAPSKGSRQRRQAAAFERRDVLTKHARAGDAEATPRAARLPLGVDHATARALHPRGHARIGRTAVGTGREARRWRGAAVVAPNRTVASGVKRHRPPPRPLCSTPPRRPGAPLRGAFAPRGRIV